MGNTLRKTFGNMCGAEASKELSSENHLKPISKPKNGKKERKEKKNKKEKNNGALQKISEEDEASQSVTQPAEKSIQNADNKTSSTPLQVSIKIDPDENFVINNSPKNLLCNNNKSSELIKDTILESDLKKKLLNNEDDTSQAKEDILNNGNLEKDNETFQVLDNSFEDMYEDSKDSVKIANNAADECNLGIHKIHEVEVVTMEELGITYADDIFMRCADEYLLFVEDCNKLHLAVVDFQKSVIDSDAAASNFEQSWKIYCSILIEEQSQLNSTANNRKVNICDIHMKVQVMRVVCLTLINTISKVLPELGNLLSEASTVDIIEYVKGTMVRGEKLGITSKFSAPGKYRRNIKKLRNGLVTLETVDRESKEILLLIERSRDEFQQNVPAPPKQVISHEEPIILPIDVQINHTKSDYFEKLESECPPSFQAEVVGQLKIEKSNAVDIKQTEVSEKFYDKRDKQKTATIQHPAEKMTTEATSVKTYIIQSIPEKSSFENPNLSQSPVSVMTHSVIMPAGPDHVKEVLIEDEEHNMLDFGKYCFIDPSTGDIQVLRNRSRSLNSLVSLNALSQSSRSSSRSNLSRFGSFEFVTGGEVLIAEKNQLATSLH